MVKGIGPAYNKVYRRNNSDDETVISINPRNMKSNPSELERAGEQLFKPASTVKSLIWKIKRWFYSRIREYEKKIGEQFDTETSKFIWKEVARQIVQFNQERELSDKPARGVVEWILQEINGKWVFVVRKIKITYYQATHEREFKVELQ